ncbi:flagellar hook-basal body protein [Vampirovibrio chlorellavorus]|uniref:flagellar hook-basal body protein n=1 Tax=Vampirovibrio chlorellavorus TaxID=758823 RepID=UPI0026F22D5B|nr:flagellar hook-basal body protein [Vampirovibrio chlorellavorus]
MLRGLYTAAAGMLASTTGTDTLASNLSNVNTVAFKGNKVNYQTFPEMLINRMSSQGQERVGTLMAGSKVHGSFVNFAPGAMKQTGNTFDLAIQGDGFFTVKSKVNGDTYYTRAGNFTMDQNGFLTTVNGDFVQGKLGNVQMALDGGPFNINGQGNVSGRNGIIAQLQIARFENNQALEKLSDNLFQATNNSKQLPEPKNGDPLGYQINSGMLEESNINPVAELVNNIQGLRLYEALQKNIHIHNDTLGKAVNEVGRPR